MSGTPDLKPTAVAQPLQGQMIRSMLPDGTVLQFPPDTPPAVVDRVFKTKLAEWQASGAKRSGVGGQPKAPEVGTGRAAVIGGTQGLTFNLGDEIAGGIGATIGRPGGGDFPGTNWSDRYDAALGEARGVQHAAQAQHPVAYGVGQAAGAIAPALVAPEAFGANFVARAPTAAGSAARGALASGIYGTATGYAAGEGGAAKRAITGAEGGALGAAAGAVLSPVARQAQRWIQGVPPAPQASSAIAQDAGTAAYTAFENNPVHLDPASVQRLVGTITQDLQRFGLRQKLQPRTHAAMDDLGELLQNPNPTMQDVELMRRIANRIFDPTNHSEGEAAGRIVEHIDDFLDNIQPGDVLAGNGQQAAHTVQNARANWSAYRKAQLIEEAVVRAQDRAASTGTGGNVVNAVRQNLRRILDSPKLRRAFTDDEIAQIRAVSRGGPIQNVVRLLSAFAPSRGALNAWLGVGAQAIPGAGMLPAIGEAAHLMGSNATLAAANRLPEMIRMNVPGAVARAPQPYSQALAQALGGGVPATNAMAQQLLRQQGPR